MSKATKAALIGMWRIDRRILDARGPDAHFTGEMTITESEAAPATLSVEESGTLRIGDQTPVLANRTYRWVFRTATSVEVLFDDGRPFHEIDLTSPHPQTRHHCPPDTYDVRYDFRLPDEWRATWTVTGPRKDYVMTSTMTRPQAQRPFNERA